MVHFAQVLELLDELVDVSADRCTCARRQGAQWGGRRLLLDEGGCDCFRSFVLSCRGMSEPHEKELWGESLLISLAYAEREWAERLPDRRLSAPSQALSIVLQELWPRQMHPWCRLANGTGCLAKPDYSLRAYQMELA